MSDTSEARGAHAPGGVAEAREALLRWVDEAGAPGRAFLQVRLRADAQGRYSVRHLDDGSRPAAELRRSRDPMTARDIAQTTATGDHRPLKTSPNLPGGWLLEELDGAGLWTALEYLYPACAVHWHAGGRETLRVTSWEETAGRQSGIYASVGLLPEPALRDAVRACCGDAVCLRKVAWSARAGEPPLRDDEPVPGSPASPAAGDARVPCPEACSLFISFAREVLSLERAAREPVADLGTLNAAEREQIRAVVSAAAGGTLGATREGDFAEPTNQRRIRYLAARLGGH